MRNPNYVIGKIWHPSKNTFVAAVGARFEDTPNYYEFYVIGSNAHFRKSMGLNDEFNKIDYSVFMAVSEVRAEGQAV